MTIENLEIKQSIDEIKTEIQNIWDKMYPIAIIYISVNSENPGTIFGGTWQSWGSGRFPVGVDANEGFNTVEQIGGQPYISIPNHHHTVRIALPFYYGAVGGEDTLDGVGVYNFNYKKYGGFALKADNVDTKINSSVTTRSSTKNVSVKTSQGQTSENGATSVEAYPPYITCYMWKRVS